MADVTQEPEIQSPEERETEVLAPAQVFDSKTLALMQRTEVDQQIATAKKWPRKMSLYGCVRLGAD